MNTNTEKNKSQNSVHNTAKYEHTIKSASPWKAMLSICIPSILIMLVAASYNVIDKFLAIKYASDDVAAQYQNALDASGMSAASLINLATTFSANIVQFNFAITLMITAGTSILFSMKYGALDKKGMSKTVNNGFTIALLTSIIVGGLVWLLLSPHFNYFLLDIQASTDSQTPEISQALDELSYQYSSIACLMLPFSFLYNIFINVYRSEGKMSFVGIVLVSSIATNVLFAVILIKYCHLMLMGAMLATGLSWVVSTLICVGYSVFSNKTYFKLNWYNLTHIDFKYIKDILSLGLTALINNLSTVVLAILLTILLGDLNLGDQENHLQILYGGISPWTFFLVAPAAGIYQGGSVLLGYAFGANRLNRYKDLMRIVWIFEIVWFTTAFLIILAFGGYMLKLFGDSYPDHRWLIVLNFMTYPFAGITYSLTTYMRNIKRAGVSTIASLFRSFVAPISLALIGYFVTASTQDEIDFFAIFGLFDFFAAIANYMLLRKEIRLYKPYHKDIDIYHPEDFTQLEVVRLNNKIEKLKEMKTASKIKYLEDYKIESKSKKIAKCIEKIKVQEQMKTDFVDRALLEAKPVII